MLQIVQATFLPSIVKFGQYLAKLLPKFKGAIFMTHSVEACTYALCSCA